MGKLDRLKKERFELEALLKKNGSEASTKALKALDPYFKEIDRMNTYYPVGRVRLVRLFLETELGENEQLFSCYGRFANLVEGVEV